jgi:hypothetical protein
MAVSIDGIAQSGAPRTENALPGASGRARGSLVSYRFLRIALDDGDAHDGGRRANRELEEIAGAHGRNMRELS